MAEAYERHRILLCSAMAACFLAAMAIPSFMGISVDFVSFRPFYVLGGLITPFLIYANWRLRHASAAGEAMLCNILFAIPLLVFSYMAMRVGWPLMDRQLAAADAALAFHSSDFVHLVDRYRAPAVFLGYCYSSFSPQILLLPLLLGAVGLGVRAYSFSLSLIVLGVVSASLSAFFPSVGAFVHFGITPGSLNNINDVYGYHFLDSFNAVRSAPVYRLSLDSASGIITFPSVHAGVAVLCAWAAWGSRWLRWPFFVLNAGMFVSALTHGAHYLVDVIAGGAVALFSIMVVNRLLRPEWRTPATVATVPRAAPAGAGAGR